MITTLLLFCFSFISKADEQVLETNHINKVENSNSPAIKDDFEWQIMIDLSAGYSEVMLESVHQTEFGHYFAPGLLIDISYKGFFLQSQKRRSSALFGGTELGYQLLVKDNWQLDIIVKGYLFGYNSSDIIDHLDADEEIFSGLETRYETGGIALRYSQYLDNSLFTIDFAAAHADVDATGLIIDSFYSYLLPYRNWDIYLGAGLTYYDKDILDYYIGINPDEVTSRRPLYNAGGGFRGQLEVYAQYPLSPTWTFNAGITHSFYNNEIKRSPLVDKNKLIQAVIGVRYVF
jgi:outer membrane scaffolding protein for murein synthesis (MipA/OmpV family)